jgi:hypothetical protein
LHAARTRLVAARTRCALSHANEDRRCSGYVFRDTIRFLLVGIVPLAGAGFPLYALHA